MPTLRFRMIFLFCAVQSVFLALTYVVVYETFATQTRLYLDDRLSDTAKFLASQLTAQPVESRFTPVSFPGQYLGMVREDGTVLSGSESLPGVAMSTGPWPEGNRPVLRSTRASNGLSLRLAIVQCRIANQKAWLILGEPISGVERIESRFRRKALFLWAISVLITTLIAAWYVARSLKPLVALNEHARLLTQCVSRGSQPDFAARLPVANSRDELGQLAINFNELFAKLDAAAQQLRQFASDAAHELRTPLSVLHGEAQLMLTQRRSVEEYESTLRTIEGELTAMVRIVEGLFTLSMSDAGQLHLRTEHLHLDEVFEEACGIAAPVARKKGMWIERQGWSQVEYLGDEPLLRQVFLILLENAIKYSFPESKILVGIEVGPAWVEVFVKDQGMGIQPKDLPFIFERFYRAAPQTLEEVRSGGLGLAIAKAIMHVHEGDVLCFSEPGRGSIFTLRFPLKESPKLSMSALHYTKASS